MLRLPTKHGGYILGIEIYLTVCIACLTYMNVFIEDSGTDSISVIKKGTQVSTWFFSLLLIYPITAQKSQEWIETVGGIVLRIYRVHFH